MWKIRGLILAIVVFFAAACIPPGPLPRATPYMQPTVFCNLGNGYVKVHFTISSDGTYRLRKNNNIDVVSPEYIKAGTDWQKHVLGIQLQLQWLDPTNNQYIAASPVLDWIPGNC